MKTLATLSLALLASWECSAQTSLFDNTTHVLDIPCVTLYSNASPVPDAQGNPTTFKVKMQAVTGTRFMLTSAVAVIPVDECLGRYDTNSLVYTDLVSLADNAFQVTMTRNADNSFTLNSYPLAGPAKTALWVVSDGTNTLYLGGSFPALRPEDHPLPRAFEEAYAKSAAMYFELDLDNPATNGTALTAEQSFVLALDPERKTLTQTLQPDTYTALGNYLAQKNIAISNVNLWSAQMVMNFLVANDVRPQIGATAKGVSAWFAEKAIADNKPIFGLETFSDQVTLFQSVNEGLEDILVRSTLDDIASGQAASDLLAQLTSWRRGDVASVHQTLAQIREENREDYDLVQTTRNQAWLTKIEALLDTAETEMVLVSTENVAGPDGLVALLKNAGYSVKKY
jgi:uncharacterized protein YbaP (TraB family)